MLFERIESRGLAHYSYLIGDQGEACVIDPRRDCDVYVDLAARRGYRIATILETHRNEDYAAGSVELAARTGADIGHADGQLPYRYGQPVQDGQTWYVGRLKVRAIHSPGHTPGSMSYLLYEPGGAPWILFSGDTLFAGDVGRVDLVDPERTEEMAGRLYDTLFRKLLPLGNEIIVCPAHGSGSACGASIADRDWTTLGLERRVNPKLQLRDRGAFIAAVGRPLEVPPYFSRMEPWNLEGAPLLGLLPVPPALSPHEIDSRLQGAVLLDTRNELSFAAAHIPGALSIWRDGVPSYAGWFLPYDTPIVLVNDTDDASEVVRFLVRLGYDQIEGYLAGGMLAWHESGLDSRTTRTITVTELCRHIDEHECLGLLDVRSDHEVQSDGAPGLPGALHIHVTQLPGRIDEVPRDRPVYIFCGSGLRSTLAAGLLQRGGWDNVAVVLGGFSAWSAAGCPITLPE